MYSIRKKKIRTKRQKAQCPSRESSLTFSNGYDRRSNLLQIAAIFVILLFAFSFILPFSNSYGAEPTIELIDQGSGISETIWSFDEPDSYNMTETEIESGKVSLMTNNYFWNQTSRSDFEKGALDNVVIIQPTNTSAIWLDDFNEPPGVGNWIYDINEEWEKGLITNIPGFMGSSPSGEYIWGTKVVGKYTDTGGVSRDYSLRSPNIDLSKYEGAKLALSFWHYHIFDNNATGNDGGIVEISVDDGDNWEIIFPKGGYKTDIDDPNNPLFDLDPSNEFFGGNSSDWVKDEFILTEYDDESNFSFRFRFATNGQDSDYGWYIDDIVISRTITFEGELEIKSTQISGGNIPDNVIQRPTGLTIIDTNNPITSDGALTQWTVYTATEGLGSMRIFREENGDFVFVGETDPVVLDVGRNIFDCLIDVQAGDYIGWYGGTSEIWAVAPGDSYQLNGSIDNTQPKSNWTYANYSHSISVTGLFRESTGTFTSQVFDADSIAHWEKIKWNEDIPNSNVDLIIQTRTGNVIDPSDLSWSSFSDPVTNPKGSTINRPSTRFIQFRATLISNKQPYTSILENISISYTKYSPMGVIETSDFIPDVVVKWLDFQHTDTSNEMTIQYLYSLDSGENWTSIPLDGDMREISVLGGQIRFRIYLSTDDTTVTPEVLEISLTYSAAQPGMGLRLEADKMEANPEDLITFRIFYNNSNIGDAKDVTIYLILDANLTYENPDALVEGNRIIWQFETVEPTEIGEMVIKVITKVKNIEDETTFSIQATLNYTDLGGNGYPGVSSNTIKIKVSPSLDILFVLLVGIILAIILVIVMITVTRRVLRDEGEERIAVEDVGRGIGYLVMEDNPKKSYGVFSDFIDSGKQGLCITRTFPGRVMSNYSFDDVSLLWLSRSRDQNSILPTNLGGVLSSVKDFMEENEDTVVLMDGLEYLMVHNDFQRVLKLVHGLNELVAINDARLIIPFNPLTMEEDKVALLKRDLKIIG